MTLGVDAVYLAWTEGFDRWFAQPGTVLMKPEIDVPFFFQTPNQHPHYGRFLRLQPDRLIELTWVTGAGGTDGAETVVTLELTPTESGGSHLRLTHAGFTSEGARDRHRDAWPVVLEQFERQLAGW